MLRGGDFLPHCEDHGVPVEQPRRLSVDLGARPPEPFGEPVVRDRLVQQPLLLAGGWPDVGVSRELRSQPLAGGVGDPGLPASSGVGGFGKIRFIAGRAQAIIAS